MTSPASSSKDARGSGIGIAYVRNAKSNPSTGSNFPATLRK